MLPYLKSGLARADLSSKFGKCHQGDCAINSGLKPYQVEYRLKSVSLDCAWTAVLWVIVHLPLVPFYTWIPCRLVVRPLGGGKLVQILPGGVMPKPGSSWCQPDTLAAIYESGQEDDFFLKSYECCLVYSYFLLQAAPKIYFKCINQIILYIYI